MLESILCESHRSVFYGIQATCAWAPAGTGRKKYIETELGTRDSIRYAGPPSDAIMDEDEMLSWL